jgi:hypothetical protein
LYLLAPNGLNYQQWAAKLPPGLNGPQDDPDQDLVPNAFEFYFGSSPTNAASGRMPTAITVTISGVNFPALTFTRMRNLSGITLLPQVSSSLAFSDNLGFTIHAVVDLGNGLEQVTIRSTVQVGAQAAQFLRLRLGL